MVRVSGLLSDGSCPRIVVKAVMLVHSFCEDATGLSDCIAFYERMGIGGVARDRLGEPKTIGGIKLWVGWAGDHCPT